MTDMFPARLTVGDLRNTNFFTKDGTRIAAEICGRVNSRDDDQSEIAKLREALKPFADFADALNEELPNDISIGIFAGGAMRFGPSGGATLGSLRAARAALREGLEQQGGV